MFNNYLPLFLKAQEIVNSEAENLLKNNMSMGYQKYFNLKVLLNQYENNKILEEPGFQDAVNDAKNPHQEFCLLV